MLNPLYCRGCGQRLEIPDGFSKAKLRCAECGVYTDLPADLREQLAAQPAKKSAAAPTASPRDAESNRDSDEAYSFLDEPTPPKPAAIPAAPKPAKSREPAEIPEREILVHGTEEDDLNPYTVRGDAPTRMCPECDRRSDARSAVCIHCGFNFETKTKAKRVYEPIHREWESGWPIQKRLALFMGMQFINLLLLVVSLFSGYSICTAIVPILMTVGLQAFLTGTFDKLILTRDSKGKVKVTRICYYAFFARPPINVRWKSHETVSIVQSNEFSVIDWAFVIILLGYGILPGVLFYWFVLRPDKFTVFLCKDHGFPETAIFRTQNEELSKEIQTAVSEVTLLPIQK